MKIIKTLSILHALLLSACLDGSGIRPAEKMLSHGWAEPSYEDAEHAPTKYCYRSLADIDCYDVPQAGRDSQLVADYPPKITKKPSVSQSWFLDRVTRDCDSDRTYQNQDSRNLNSPKISDDPTIQKNINRKPLSVKGVR